MKRVQQFLITVLIWLVLIPSSFAGTCFLTGNGPITLCIEGDTQVLVTNPFTYSRTGQFFSWNERRSAYCTRNEYGRLRCMQSWKVERLNCYEDETGGLVCD